MLPVTAAVTAEAREGTPRWTAFAYLLTAATLLGVGACMWGIPLPLTDNAALLVEVQQMSFAEVLRDRMLATNYLRPLFWAQLKLLLTLSDGHYFLAFRGFHVLQLGLTALMFTRVLRIGTAASAVAFSIALMVLFGMHTLTISLIEGPLTAVFCCMAAVYLSFGAAPSRWKTIASLVLLLYAALSVELGLLVWVVYVAAWVVGCRGLSGRAVAANTVLVALYFLLRFIVLPSADTGLVHRETGVGFSMKEPADAIAAVGGRAVNLYAYNVGSSVLSVLAAEPRAGIWVFARRYAEDEVAPWQWIHLISSSLTSLCLVWYVAVRAPSWWRWSFTRDDRFVWVFAGVLAASAVMGFAYTREAILGPAGVLYALAVFAACHAMLTRAAAARWPAQMAVALLLLAVSAGWSARTAGLTYVLRDSAFERRNDWAMGVEYLEKTGHMPADAPGRGLIHRLRDDALARPVPSPRWAQPWLEEYADRLF